MSRDYDKFVDAKGLKCPQPLLLAKQGIGQIEQGQILLLETTDPHTDLDLEVWCERFGHKVIHSNEKNSILKFWLEKG